ncbi:hypothetical protein N9R54_01680 [Pelobium sp.]|nr:HEPN domain-containing protein [Pelobium sp.]MDA9554920.1 hypothetical protein [Pelobium sp.]
MKIDEYKNRINQLITLGDQTLSTKRISDFSTFVDSGLFASFRSASLSFLKSLYGEEHPFYDDFNNRCRQSYFYEAEIGKGILLSVKQEIENGWLFSVKSLVTSEIFSDFLEMSKYLLEEKYKDPAAVMIGSVLEEHLRQLSLKNGIPTETIKDGKPNPKKADLLNSELANKNIYNKLEQKSVTAWLDLRNKAAHGKYTEYTQTQVEIMYQGVLDFMNRNIL